MAEGSSDMADLSLDLLCRHCSITGCCSVGG